MTSFEMLVGRIQATSEALQQDALVVINRNVTEGRVALSNRLQVKLPGLRGFSASSMIFMRLFYEAWATCPEIRNLVSDEFHYFPSNESDNATIHYLPSNEFVEGDNRQRSSSDCRPLPTDELEMMPIRHLPSVELTKEQITAAQTPLISVKRGH